MKLEIILRTCDRGNVSKFPRFISVSKAELILGCVASLINAANQVVSHHIHFKILDDHSTSDTLHQLHLLFKKSKHSYEFNEGKSRTNIGTRIFWKKSSIGCKNVENN
jgi:hypothetical protein